MRWAADTRIVVISPVRIATNVTLTSTIVMSSSASENPSSLVQAGGKAHGACPQPIVTLEDTLMFCATTALVASEELPSRA